MSRAGTGSAASVAILHSHEKRTAWTPGSIRGHLDVIDIGFRRRIAGRVDFGRCSPRKPGRLAGLDQPGPIGFAQVPFLACPEQLRDRIDAFNRERDADFPIAALVERHAGERHEPLANHRPGGERGQRLRAVDADEAMQALDAIAPQPGRMVGIDIGRLVERDPPAVAEAFLDVDHIRLCLMCSLSRM
jgi:hypothetical protein